MPGSSSANELLLLAFSVVSISLAGTLTPSAPRIPDVIYFRRSRKAGSGSIAAFIHEELIWRVGPREKMMGKAAGIYVYSAPNTILKTSQVTFIDTGTMAPFDSCCLLDDCPTHSPDRSPAYLNSSVFTITHLREPVSWREAEYWHAGLGSKLVIPRQGERATSKNSTAMWAAWMAEGDRQWMPKQCGGVLPIEGYRGKLHEGFGFYQSNFLIRNLLAECGCQDPFTNRGMGNCKAGNTKLPRNGKAPIINQSDVARAKLVLGKFDLVIPVERYNHPLVPYFILWKMGFPYECDLLTNNKGGTHRPHLGHLHAHEVPAKSKSGSAPASPSRSPLPLCIEEALREQNKLETALYQWALDRFDFELGAFEQLGPNTTCLYIQPR
eukprot:CAMPEP_0171933864 /NCGR_PEP_ID=MMETSP0993-20121228/31523_1 /TAXON_ID=483369 /ORGANISM="non described non described, Strain CCMP2098" /LENGTH=381 /DNA_ID=CAMNT_0012574439 /DNA_START=32 /DNA_END=1177 /DNA_ORIENTATION=+